MRAPFSFLYFAATFALSGNAALLSKGMISLPVDECVSLTQNAGTKFEILSTSFAAFQAEDRFGTTTTSPRAAVSVTQQQREKLLEDGSIVIEAINNARSKCCGNIVHSSSTDEDSEAISSALENYSSAVTNALNTLLSNIAAFDKNGDSYSDVQFVLGDLDVPIKAFLQCLLPRDRSKDNTKAMDYEEKVHKTFNEVANAFEVYRTSIVTDLPSTK